jgi:hypothetical protein
MKYKLVVGVKKYDEVDFKDLIDDMLSQVRYVTDKNNGLSDKEYIEVKIDMKIKKR